MHAFFLLHVFDSKLKKKHNNVIEEVKGKSITDLFLYSEKIIDDENKEILIVELKSQK